MRYFKFLKTSHGRFWACSCAKVLTWGCLLVDGDVISCNCTDEDIDKSVSKPVFVRSLSGLVEAHRRKSGGPFGNSAGATEH